MSTYSGIVQIAAGYNHCACLNDLGRVIGIGNNSDGQCDFNSWFNIKDISARFKHTVGLMNNGRVVAVGNNDYNQCEVDSWSGITAIAAGWGHTVGLRSDGTVITTGYNYSGQCDVSGWSGITQICSGYDHTVGLKADGTVVAAGSGTKCKVESWKDIIAISAGSAFTVGLKSDGTVVAAGNGGECDVGSWTGIIGISAGIRHTIGWKADGTVVIAGEHTPLRNWDITPSPNWPIRISPQHQSVENVLPQIFKWYPEPTAAKYALQVSESPDFSNLQIDKKNIIDTSYLVSTLDYETNYFWRINATNENGTSNWTPARSFTTQMLSTPEEPVAAFSENPTVGTAPLTVAFTNQSTGDIVSYSWDFGDGTAESTVQNPTHTYTSSGVYDVRLIAHGPVESDTIIKNSLITVQAQVPQYQITISSGGNGTVSPSGVLTVSQGSSVSVTAIPSVGYHFLNWNVSAGITITENGSTGIFTISGNGTIQTNFSPNTYTITVNETGNGTVSPPGDNTVTYGSDLTISAVADAGYHFVKWTATSGITVENDTAATTTIKNINMPGTVTANFAINQHKITILTSGNGTTNPAGNITVNYGNSVSIQAIADTGYHFVKWNISGSLNVSDPGNPVILIDNITSNGSITALFSSDTLPGNILIDSISAQAKVYLYATNSWTGKVVLTGPGIIKSLKPGIYRLCVINDNKRSFYKTVSVAENTTTYIHASIADAVPLIFTTKAQVLDDNNMPINLNPAGSAIMDDIDKDGITELIIASQSGIFTIYKKIDGYSISKTFSLTLNSNDTVNCIRIADLEYDNTPDLIVGLNTGRMLIADTNGSVTGTLYTTSTGLTGFDFIDYNKDSYPDILLGFADGSIKVAQSTGNLIWNSPSTLNSSVNSIATPIFMDLDGNGKPDIISGNGSGEVNWFSDTGTFSFMAKGSINSGGIPLKLSSNTSLSTVYNDGTALPGVVTTDGSGNIFKVQSVICGDINNDGIVDILDLQQMGIHWGTIATDSVWSGQVNLNLTPGNDGVQVIDILDLQALGKSWGMVR